MRHLTLLFAFALPLLVACGGSSSETPPPLEPDSRSFAGKNADPAESAKPLPPPPEEDLPPPTREDHAPSRRDRAPARQVTPSGTSVPNF
jgi:hypothetical protein